MCALFTMPSGSQSCFEGARIWNYLEQTVKQNPERLIWFSQFQAIFMLRLSFHNFHFAKAAHKRCVDRSVKYIDRVVRVTSRACASECFFLSTCATQTHLECNIHAYTLGHNNWPQTVCHSNSMLSMTKCNRRKLAYKSTTISPILARFTNQNDCKWFEFVFIK